MYCGGGHLGFPIDIKNINLVENLPMIIPGQFGFNCPSGFREEADPMGKCSNAFFSAIKDGQSRENGSIGYTRRRGNQRWTIQRKWQAIQDEGAIKDGQSRENCRVHKTKGQSKIDNQEKMAA
jgi:hypothetical protein